jgi:hypothetical protein
MAEDLMNEEEKKKIEEIIDGLKCPKDFRCAQSGFDRLCKARDIGLKSLLLCFDEKPATCKFALSFGSRHFFCECPLRVYLATKLKR